MRKIVKIFYGLETTGTDERKHGIHQFAGIVEVNGEIVEEFDYKVAPNPKAQITPEAMKVGGVTEAQIKAYPEMGVVYRKFVALLAQYCDRYNPQDKIWLVGFNNRNFDDRFLRAWFDQNGDSYFNAWFWSDSLDVMIQASEYLIERRHKMPNFKLCTVAKTVGLVVNEDKLHDGLYDVKLTREVYNIVTGREIEL